MNKLPKKIKIVVPLVSIMTSLTAYAADLPPPTIIDENTITRWIINIGNFMIQAGMVLGVIMVVYGGIRWMMGGVDSKGVGEAKELLKSSVIGIAIILGVGLIIKTIASLITGSFFGG